MSWCYGKLIIIIIKPYQFREPLKHSPIFQTVSYESKLITDFNQLVIHIIILW